MRGTLPGLYDVREREGAKQPKTTKRFACSETDPCFVRFLVLRFFVGPAVIDRGRRRLTA